MDNNKFFNSVDLLRLIIKWKKHLITVGLIALVGSVLFSSPIFMKPRFKSFALVYPSNLIAYSTESATEQMLQLTQSYDIRDRIIRTFDLYNHYDIDTIKNKTFKSDVYKKYDENIQIKKTEYESMEITVYDTDPIKASAIADSIIHYFDLKARSLQVEKSYEVMIITGNQLVSKRAEMDSMESLLHDYSMKYGIIDYKSQAKEVTRAYMRGLSISNSKVINETKSILEGLKEKGTEFNALTEHLWRIRGTYNDLKLANDNAKKDVFKKLTYANVVTKPFPSDKKAYPVRWLIVLISTGSALLLSFMILIIFDTKKNLS